jgi:hypothetical protein
LLQRYLGDLPGDLADLEPTAEAFARWHAFDRVTWPVWLRSRGASPGAVTLMTLGGDSRELSALYVLRQVVLLRKSDQFYKIRRHGPPSARDGAAAPREGDLQRRASRDWNRTPARFGRLS